MRMTIISINYIFIYVYDILPMCKLYQITYTGSGVFLSVWHRDEVRTGVYFPWENDEVLTVHLGIWNPNVWFSTECHSAPK